MFLSKNCMYLIIFMIVPLYGMEQGTASQPTTYRPSTLVEETALKIAGDIIANRRKVEEVQKVMPSEAFTPVKKYYYLLSGKYLNDDTGIGFSIDELLAFNRLVIKEEQTNTGLRISLANNNIDNLKGIEKIKGIKEAAYLILSSNRLKAITKNQFSCCTSLTHLDLNRNQIATIEAQAFADLSSLATLLLVTNNLEALTPGMFDGLKSLKTLMLTRNSIAIIEPTTFDPLVNLTYLDLGRNQLTTFGVNLVKNLQDLRVLTLFGNKLTFIDPAIITTLPQLNTFAFSDNPLSSANEQELNKLRAEVLQTRLTPSSVSAIALPN
jgi:hypothetical protein